MATRRQPHRMHCKECGESFLRLGDKIGKYCSRKCAARVRYRTDPEKQRERCRKWRADNPEKFKESKRKWNEKHPEAVLRHARRGRLLYEYGINHDQYDSILSEQGGCCLICGIRPADGKNLAVDHSHSTGAVRGLICHACNRGIGSFRDSPQHLRRAADYLEGKLN